MSRIAVLTDSVACLEEEDRARLDVEVVPTHLILDGVDLLDGVDITPEEHYRRLQDAGSFSSAAPSVGQWGSAFERVAGRGYQALLVVPVSGRLSSTLQNARLAADLSPVPVEVVETGTAAAAEGLLVVRLAEMAQAGATMEELVGFVEEHRGNYHFLATVAGLEQLERSGRVPQVVAFLGGRLRLKPLIELRGDGAVHPVGAVREVAHGMARILDRLAHHLEGSPPARVVVVHAGMEAQALDLARRVRERVAPDRLSIAPFSPVMVTHTGPLVGLAWEDPPGT